MPLLETAENGTLGGLVLDFTGPTPVNDLYKKNPSKNAVSLGLSKMVVRDGLLRRRLALRGWRSAPASLRYASVEPMVFIHPCKKKADRCESIGSKTGGGGWIRTIEL